MSYTKGPWRLDMSGNEHHSEDYHEIEGGCGFHTKVGEDDTRQGFSFTGMMSLDDARLAAAAPELLEALEALTKEAVKLAERETKDASETIWALIEDATDAIAKARG